MDNLGMFHIEYIPTLDNRIRQPKGNGNKAGCPIGRKLKPLADMCGVINRNGCLRHGYTDCLTCPRATQGLDCDWNYDIELKLEAQQKKASNP